MKVERLFYLCCQEQSLVVKNKDKSTTMKAKQKRNWDESVDICNSKKKFAMAKRRRHVHNQKNHHYGLNDEYVLLGY